VQAGGWGARVPVSAPASAHGKLGVTGCAGSPRRRGRRPGTASASAGIGQAPGQSSAQTEGRTSAVSWRSLHLPIGILRRARRRMKSRSPSRKSHRGSASGCSRAICWKVRGSGSPRNVSTRRSSANCRRQPPLRLPSGMVRRARRRMKSRSPSRKSYCGSASGCSRAICWKVRGSGLPWNVFAQRSGADCRRQPPLRLPSGIVRRARRRMKSRSPSRKSYCGSASGCSQAICWKVRGSGSPRNVSTR